VKSQGIIQYYLRFAQALWRELKEWPRDNVVIAGIAAVGPPVVVYLRDPSKLPDWEMLRATCWIYLSILGVYTLIQIVRTPWTLDRDRITAITTLEHERDELLAEKKALEDARPNIILREPGAKHVETISLANNGVIVVTAQFVKVRFVNRPAANSSSAVARGVRALIKFFGEDGQLVLETDGRWDDSKQPGIERYGATMSDLLPIDFGIEEARNLDIAFFDPRARAFVAWNNDNYRYQNFIKPEHILRGEQFTAEMRLVGVGVDVTYSVRFGLDSLGKVKIIESTMPMQDV
jgi:hypothetical protein